MAKRNIKDILEKVDTGNHSGEEEQVAKLWLFQLNQNKDLNLSDEKLAEVSGKMWSVIEESYSVYLEPKKVKLWPRIMLAAAAVTAVVFGVYFFTTNRHLDTSVSRTAGRDLLNDIAPGKNGATITLANGKVIELSDAKSGVVIGDRVSYSDGSVVRYSSGTSSSGSLKGSQNSTGPVGVRSLSLSDLQGADSKGQMLTASTAKGQTYQFTLPDGTRVWLNADSRLEFASNFVNGKKRNVKLVGEGYFEVAKDKVHPFIVKSAGQEVEVLGTHFNINSYADEKSIKTTLLEGSVMVSHQGKKMPRLVLKPGMQSELDDIGLSSSKVDVNEVVAWTTGDFIFSRVSLADIMKSIARWYDVEISYEQGFDTDQTFSVLVSRNKNISQILLSLEKTGKVKFKIEGKKVRVSK